jgi:hypothetical protein
MKVQLILLDENKNEKGIICIYPVVVRNEDEKDKQSEHLLHHKAWGFGLNNSIPRETFFIQSPIKEKMCIPEATKTKVKKNIGFIKKICITIIDSNIFVGFMTLCTIFALFLNDIQAAFLHKNTDEIMDDIQTVLLFIFGVEIIMTVIARKGYTNSFFFWLDIIATASFIQDIDWIINGFSAIGSQ